MNQLMNQLMNQPVTPPLMTQLLLDINTEISPSFDTFVVGRHAELTQLLRLFSQRMPNAFGERAVYLWGENGAGKSHLLRALANTPASCYFDPSNSPADINYSPEINLYLLDDCQALNDDQQIAAFNLFNQAKENNAYFVAAGSMPPARLSVREDLRTRLGWGLIYQLHGLTDEEKIAALDGTAHARGITIPSGVLPYLINHYQRDMPSLINMMNALITFSLENKKPITLPLVRTLIQQYA